MPTLALEATSQHEPQAGSSSAETIDRAAILRLVNNDIPLLHELITTFLEESPRLLDDIKLAIWQVDAKKLKLCAHTLKGSASAFSSQRACEAAQVLEAMGQHGDLAHADAALTYLEIAVSQLQSALGCFAAEFSS